MDSCTERGIDQTRKFVKACRDIGRDCACFSINEIENIVNYCYELEIRNNALPPDVYKEGLFSALMLLDLETRAKFFDNHPELRKTS